MSKDPVNLRLIGLEIALAPAQETSRPGEHPGQTLGSEDEGQGGPFLGREGLNLAVGGHQGGAALEVEPGAAVGPVRHPGEGIERVPHVERPQLVGGPPEAGHAGEEVPR